jgi:two-component system, NarL family, invasion response regulator UvrY
MTSFRVLIVHAHLLVRTGLRHLLTEEYRGVVFGEARTAGEALAQVAKHPWDMVVLDIGIPDTDGFCVLQETLLRRPATRVLMLSIKRDPLHAERARQMGASGYLSKDAGRSELVKAFRDVLAGRRHFGKYLPGTSPAQANPGRLSLSAREHDVLLAFAAGRRMSEIAAEFSLSIKTVSTYKRRILDKLHLRSTADLVHYVIDHRLH